MLGKRPKILLADDDLVLTRGLEAKFKNEGYDVLKTPTAAGCLDLVLKHHPDLIVLDQMLQDGSGLDVCRELRRRGSGAVIVFLTMKGQEVDRILGLELGADDYMTKPFSLGELLARVRAHLRRFSSEPEEMQKCRFGEVEVDFKGMRVTRRGRSVGLTNKEFELLRLLVQRRGEVLTRDRILDEIWGYDASSTTRTVDTHIARLRQKLEHNSSQPEHILSVYGEGYKFIE